MSNVKSVLCSNFSAIYLYCLIIQGMQYSLHETLIRNWDILLCWYNLCNFYVAFVNILSSLQGMLIEYKYVPDKMYVYKNVC